MEAPLSARPPSAIPPTMLGRAAEVMKVRE